MGYSKSRLEDLKPLEKNELRWRHCTFDIETDPIGRSEIPKFVYAGFFDGRSYSEFGSPKSLVSHLLKKRFRSTYIYAHNAGKFDSLLILDELKARKRRVDILQVGSSAVELKIHHGDRHYTIIRDSFAILPRSLKSLCDTFKPNVRKLDGAINFAAGECFDPDIPLHRQYLENDCRSLWHVIEKYKAMPFVKDVRPKPTLASTAMAAWRTTLKKPIRATSQEVQDFCREAYAGGRTEIFKTVTGKGHCYDVNSLYPSQMLQPIPVEKIRPSRDPFEFGFHRVSVFVPDTYMPILWSKRGKLFFPTGFVNGVFFSEELKLAVSQGARILKHHEGYHFSQDRELFTEFVNGCYNLRLQNPDTAIDFIAKLLLNSSYGKFAQKEESRGMVCVDQNDPSSFPKGMTYIADNKRLFEKTGMGQVENWRRSPHMLCHVSAAITAYGRIHMAEKFYLPYQNSLAYTDTDSAFITKEFPSGRGLGEVKKEYSYKRGLFVLPKGYFIELEDGSTIRKLKGFSKNDLNKLGWENFADPYSREDACGRELNPRAIRESRKTLLTLRESLIRKNTYISVAEKSRRVISAYNKRRVMPDGRTEPLHMTKDGEIK